VLRRPEDEAGDPFGIARLAVAPAEITGCYTTAASYTILSRRIRVIIQAINAIIGIVAGLR
jgi:hypothetical protein